MSVARDLAWQRLDEAHRSSIAQQMARYVLEVDFESLPPAVVHQAKRILLDTLGCAIGATEAPGRPIVERTVKAMGGPAEATVFGSGFKTSISNATLVNSFMVRYLDANDVGGGGHNSESIPPILALCERERANARAFLTAVVVAYEIGGRIRDSASSHTLENRGWHVDCRAGVCMPAALGKLMGLNEEQIANAIGIGTAHAPSLGILDADREELMMAKNLRFGFASQHAILACHLAKEGFTGFRRAIEGDKGFRQCVSGDEMDLEKLVDFSGWKILEGSFKTVCQNWHTQAHILSTLALVKEHDLKPSDIESVRIKTCARDARHVTSIAKKYPRNTETATHTAFYGNAIVIVDRAFGPEQLRPEKFGDPVVLDMIERITVEADPDLPFAGPGGSSEIRTKDGRVLHKSMAAPHGDKSDPLTDAEVEEKFRSFARPFVDQAKIQAIIDTVWDVEKLDTMDKLINLMVWA